jgi:trehalose 6-phosphate synthase
VTDRPLIIASNRGPISFLRTEDGDVIPKRGGGGLVTALTGALQLSGGLWIASAMSEEDRDQAAGGRVDVATDDAKFSLRYLSFDPGEYDRFYNGVSNRILWFLHHYLWDLPRNPRFDEATEHAWASYVRVNQAFADALAEESQAVGGRPIYLVQDYHLSLTPRLLRERRPDARISYFSHIPFAGPGYFRTLPGTLQSELLSGLLGADVVGFHARAWAENFLLSCRALPGARVEFRRRIVQWQGRRIRVQINPISIEVGALKEEAAAEPMARARKALAAWLGQRRLVLRVDRTDLSKNILRGLLAFELFLRRHPDWRRRVVHLALLNPSRESVPEYRAYTRECVRTAERINDELGDEDWQPVDLRVQDDYPLSLASYSLYDVLLVNPVIDGMNLVAKEGPILNRRNGVLILSENAGAFDELGPHALGVNPFDIRGTAEAIARALEMPDHERAARATRLRSAVRRNRLDRWVHAQIDDLRDDPDEGPAVTSSDH